MYYSSHVSVYPPSPLPPTLSLCHITTRHFSRCPTTFLSSHIFSFACCSRAIKLLKKKKTTITLIFPTHNVEHTNTIATMCECVCLCAIFIIVPIQYSQYAIHVLLLFSRSLHLNLKRQTRKDKKKKNKNK